MAKPLSIAAWLQQARKSWVVLAQGLLWVCGILGGFLLPPPVSLQAGEEKIWLRLGQFIIAFVLGLAFFAGLRWRQLHHALWWYGAALLLLLAGIGMFFRYQQLTLAWTENYAGAKVVIGSDYTPVAMDYAKQHPGISCADLLMDFAGATESIWTRDSIRRHRLILAGTYIVCMPLFALCLIALVQGIQCASPVARRKRAKKSPAATKPTR
jgi:hypothetical protein